ncbi:MAG: D-alanine--D-alanine ligase [Clostridiales bacterium]|nr:D-alanine--D-alanine ligase [Clostridiales bacterium]
MKIVVLAGGISTERDVSLISGRNIYQALKKNGHQVILIDLFLGLPEINQPLEELFTSDIDWTASIGGISAQAPDLDRVKALRPDYKSLLGPNVLELCRISDMVFLGLHGSNGEDGRIQALFDLMGIRYTGTGHTSSALSMDKNITKQMFRGYGVPTPPGTFLRKGQSFELPESIGFPCMVKTCCGGSSVGVYRANDSLELQSALEEAFSYEDQVIIERCIIGREFSVGVVERKALPVIEIAPLTGFYDYRNKYQAGSTVETCPADLPGNLTARMQKHAEEACAAVGIQGYARVDFMLDERSGEDYALEVNTLPGMTPTSLLPQEAAALGYSFEQLCEWLLEVSMKKYQ